MRYWLLVSFLFSIYFGSSQNLRSGGKLKPEQANMDIRHYTLALDVDPQQKTINGYTEIDLILSKESGVLLLDLWNGLTVKQILVNGKQQTFVHQNDLITINASQPWPAGKIKIKESKIFIFDKRLYLTNE